MATKNFVKIYEALKQQEAEFGVEPGYNDNRILLLEQLETFVTGKNTSRLNRYPIDWTKAPPCDVIRKGTESKCRRQCPIDDGTVHFVQNRTLDIDNPKYGFLDACPSHPTESMKELNKNGTTKKTIDKIHDDLEQITKSLTAIHLSLSGQTGINPETLEHIKAATQSASNIASTLRSEESEMKR